MDIDEQPTHSIPQPRLARRLLAVELPPPVAEVDPRYFMVEQPKHNISELQFEIFPSPSTFLYWKTNFKTRVFPVQTTQRKLCHGRKKSRWQIQWTIFGRPDRFLVWGYQSFATLDARIATALKKIIQNSKLTGKVHPEEQKAQNEVQFPHGRQTAFMIHEYHRVTGAHETILAFSVLIGELTWRRCAVFYTWDEVLLSEHEVPPDGILETLYKTRIRESDQLKTVLALYEQDIIQKDMPPSFQRLKTMMKTTLEQKKGARIKARNERTVTETPAKSRSKGKSVSVRRKQGDCYQRKAKGKCTKDDSCSFRHDCSKREQVHVLPVPLQKPQTNNPRGSSPCGKRLQKPCKDYSKGNCTTPSSDSWRPPVCQNYKLQTGCKLGKKFSFLHKETDRQTQKAKWGRENRTVALFFWNVKHLGCVFQDAEPPKVRSILRKSTNSLRPKRRVQFAPKAFASCKNPEEKNNHSE